MYIYLWSQKRNALINQDRGNSGPSDMGWCTEKLASANGTQVCIIKHVAWPAAEMSHQQTYTFANALGRGLIWMRRAHAFSSRILMRLFLGVGQAVSFFVHRKQLAGTATPLREEPVTHRYLRSTIKILAVVIPVPVMAAVSVTEGDVYCPDWLCFTYIRCNFSMPFLFMRRFHRMPASPWSECPDPHYLLSIHGKFTLNKKSVFLFL